MSEKCDPEVFQNGITFGYYDNMTKAEADEFCKNESERTGNKYDWHYVAGRVHIKYIPRVVPTKTVQNEQESKSMKAYMMVAVFRDAKGILTSPQIWLGAVEESIEGITGRWEEFIETFDTVDEPIASHILEVNPDGRTRNVTFAK